MQEWQTLEWYKNQKEEGCLWTVGIFQLFEIGMCGFHQMKAETFLFLFLLCLVWLFYEIMFENHNYLVARHFFPEKSCKFHHYPYQQQEIQIRGVFDCS